MNLAVYIILLLCMISMGLRSLLFNSRELNDEYFEYDKLMILRKRYRIFGTVDLVSAVLLLILAFIK